MKQKELITQATSELEKKKHELHLELMKENTQRNLGTQLKSPAKIRNIKKTIARITQELERKKTTTTK